MDWKQEYRDALLDTSIKSPDIRSIVKPHIPSKLYKYGSFDSQYWKEVIYKAQIYLSPAKVLIVEQILIIKRQLAKEIFVKDYLKLILK